MREIRDRVSAEIVGKTSKEIDHWLHAHSILRPSSATLGEPTPGKEIVISSKAESGPISDAVVRVGIVMDARLTKGFPARIIWWRI